MKFFNSFRNKPSDDRIIRMSRMYYLQEFEGLDIHGNLLPEQKSSPQKKGDWASKIFFVIGIIVGTLLAYSLANVI